MEKQDFLPRNIKFLVVHCSATRCDASFSVEQLRRCHLSRGFKGIGYHFYITRDGVVYPCRPLDQPGAHARGFNFHSIGICYEGGLDERSVPADTRTHVQEASLFSLLQDLKRQYPESIILGHYQLSADIHKVCPCFDARKEYQALI